MKHATAVTLTALALSATATHGLTIFDADFDAATPGTAGSNAAWETLLESGTATGDWTVDDYSGDANGTPAIYTDAGATGPQAAYFALGTFDSTANLASTATLSDGVTIDFDIASIKGRNSPDTSRRTQIIGLDSSGVEIFRLQATQVNEQTGTPTDGPSMDYYDATDALVRTWALVGGGTIIKNDSPIYVPGDMTSVSVSLDGTGFDLTVGGNAIVSDVAYLNGGGAGDLAEIRFLGNDRGSIWLDNLSVDVVPEPGSVALLGVGTLLIARRRRAASI